MRSMMKAIVAVGIGLAMCAGTASADYESEMREMREMVLKLQDQMQAQQGQIDVQKDVIAEAGLEEERGSSSNLSSFLENTEFGGWAATSYFWNFNTPNASNPNSGVDKDGIEVGPSPLSNPFHSNHNSFQLDEVWFTMGNEATEDSPAGFQFELTYGETGEALNEATDGFWIPAANVSYMTPIGPTITAGKFGTTIGYEVAGAPSNVNITRGFTYNLFQPISHTGVKISQDLDGGLSYTLGLVNGFGTEDPAIKDTKGFLWGLGWGNDTASVSFNGFYSSVKSGGSEDMYVLDLVAELTPSDNTLLWLNADLVGSEVGSSDPVAFGLSVGGRQAINDVFGIGARVEVGTFKDDGQVGPTGAGIDFDDIWSLTGTTDYMLTDNLMWKVEVKYEDGGQNIYADGKTSTSDEAVWVGTQLYYQF